MPIRARERKYYDARWRKFRLSALEAAGNVCQRCGRSHRLLNFEQGVPLEDVQRLAGHADPRTTRLQVEDRRRSHG